MNYHRKTVSSLVNNWKRGTFVTGRKKTVRQCKLTAQKVYKILSYFTAKPFNTYKDCIRDLQLLVSPMTIARAMSKNGIKTYVGCSKQFLSMQNQIKRLKFAIKYQHWTSSDWTRVVSLDEKTIQTYANGKVLVKRRAKERYDADKLVTAEVQNTNNKVNLVGMISFNGPNMIYSAPTKLNSRQFKQLMMKKVESHISNRILLMDNCKIHGEGIKYLLQSGVKVILDYPPKSPDLNPIENIWAELQKKMNRKLRNICVSTKDQLHELIRESWREIPSSLIRTCMLSMPKRLKEVIRLRGKQTKY